MDAGGAALGAGFGLLLETVKESIDKTVMFKPTLKSIKGTLECLQPLIQDIKGLNMELDLPEGETTDFDLEMKQGEKLVAKCSKVSRWKFFKKSRYTGKLLELDQTLKRLIRILQVQGTRDTKENLKLTREIHTSFIRNNGGNNRVVCDSIISARTCGVPQVLPPLIMGMDEALEELKMRLLLKDGASLLVVTAPGGCGKKTLLAQKFCLDHQSPRSPSLSAIVQQLYKQKRQDVPVLINEADATIHLEQLLNQIGGSPILLVLDDVWPASQSLVENFVLFRIPDYKILVTSRSPLPSLGPIACQYELNSLNDKDAMTLFHHWASMEDESSHIPDDVVKKIVDSHKVIPLALKVVAGSLSGQPADVWMRKMKECSDGSSLFKNDSYNISAMLPNLKELYVEYCQNLGELPAGVCDITPLQNISITNCHQLSALPDEKGKLVDLEVLRLRSCIELRGLPESIRNLSNLFLLTASAFRTCLKMLMGRAV